MTVRSYACLQAAVLHVLQGMFVALTAADMGGKVRNAIAPKQVQRVEIHGVQSKQQPVAITVTRLCSTELASHVQVLLLLEQINPNFCFYSVFAHLKNNNQTLKKSRRGSFVLTNSMEQH